MMDDEKQLTNQLGRKRPFSVPEGYFENLTQRVMERVGEKPAPTVTLWQRVRRPLAVAASVCVLVGVGLAFLHQTSEQVAPQPIQEVAQATQTDSSARLTAQASLAEAAKSYYDEKMDEAIQKVRVLEQQTASANETLTNVNQRLTNASKTLTSTNQRHANSGQTVAYNEEHLDVLDAAADYVMADAADLYAMLEDE